MQDLKTVRCLFVPARKFSFTVRFILQYILQTDLAPALVTADSPGFGLLDSTVSIMLSSMP